MTRLGLNLPNRPFTADEPARILACHPGDLVDLDIFAWRWLALPAGLRVHLRYNERGPFGDVADPSFEANRLADLSVSGAATVRSRNEPNVESPTETPDRWHEYLVNLARLYRGEKGRAALSVAAISPSTADALSWIQASCDAAKLAGFDAIDAHAYGHPDEVAAVLAEYRALWSGRLFLSEYNPGAGRVFTARDWTADLPVILRIAEEYQVEALCLFSWEWVHPDVPLPSSVNVKGTDVETFLQSWRPNVSQDERTRYFADLWKRFNQSYVPHQGITDFWTGLANQGVWLGPPIESPHPSENGQWMVQAFASDVISYNNASGHCQRGLPPLA